MGASIPHEADGGEAGAIGIQLIDCPLFSTLIFNKVLTNWYYLAIYKRAIFVPVLINQLKQFTYEKLHHSKD